MVLRGSHGRPVGWIAVGAVLAAVLLAGCSATPPSPNSGAGTPPAGTIGSGAGTANPTATNPTGVSTNPPSFPTTADAYAQATVAAWLAHDTARLDQLKAADLKLFASIDLAGSYDTHYTLYRCDGAAGSSYCTLFNNAGDALTLQLQNQLVGQAHAVISGNFDPTTFPADNQAYAQLALNAWLNHNDIRLGLLTTDGAHTGMNAISASLRVAGWTFLNCQGAAGSTYCSWQLTAQGKMLSFRFSNQTPPAVGQQHRIVGVS